MDVGLPKGLKQVVVGQCSTSQESGTKDVVINLVSRCSIHRMSMDIFAKLEHSDIRQWRLWELDSLDTQNNSDVIADLNIFMKHSANPFVQGNRVRTGCA